MTSPRSNITIISPHFDDVPLSLGESLRSGSLARHRVRVRVAFGRTNWTSWVHPTPSRARAVSLWRRMEETFASVAFGYSWTAAGWSEVMLRTGRMDPSEFLDAECDISGDPLVAEISQWLRAVISPRAGNSSPRPDLVLVPAGIGGHRDHRMIASAAADLLDRTDMPIGFYEDRPYTAYMSPEDRADHMARLNPRLAPVAVSGALRRSTQMLSRLCYPSQMSPYFLDAMKADRADSDHERIWFPDQCPPGFLIDCRP